MDYFEFIGRSVMVEFMLVIPAKAGLSTAELVIQLFRSRAGELDPSFRWDDEH